MDGDVGVAVPGDDGLPCLQQLTLLLLERDPHEFHLLLLVLLAHPSLQPNPVEGG